ncbi:MAG: trypsin-like peptidase domain-containing protein [Kofleriaceae bacterium]|nr:trypsin-like peptidase domain-containing protein [Kofleriaceae bacterium]MCB9575011.1 trypsin-like peptidase domain-containing protein [Kofleriaceae bacterium]
MSQLAPDSPFAQLSSSLAGAVDRVAPSVVRVARRRGGGGSGIVWSDDLVVTSAFHAPERTTVGVARADGTLDERDATRVGRDPGTDVAVLRIDGGGLTPAPFRELDGLGVGALTLALGRPGKTIRASLRIVGVLGPEVRTAAGGRLDRWVETDRQLPRGFAGGPLIDAAGEVIGLDTRTLVRDADLAVPTATLRRVVAELLAHGGVRRGYLGVGAYPVALPAALAAQLGQDAGALVASVEDGGPAATAGVLVGDILTRLDGERLAGPVELRAALLDRGGREVDVELVRAGVVRTDRVTIGSRS